MPADVEVIVEDVVEACAEFLDAGFFECGGGDEVFGGCVEAFGDFVHVVEGFIVSELVGFGEDDEDGQLSLCDPVVHHHVVFGGHPSDVEEEEESEQGFSLCEVIVHHIVP